MQVWCWLLPPANEVWGKVICLQACVCPRGDACSRGVPGTGGAWSGGCMVPGVPGGDPPPPTATAAGGTHPTGMHSCSLFSYKCLCTVNFGIWERVLTD